MNSLKNLFLFNRKPENKKGLYDEEVDEFKEIAKLVKEARINQNLSIQDLSQLTKIPEQTINSIENNFKSNRPKYPFIRSILIKLEECLGFKKNTLVRLIVREKRTLKKGKRDFIVNKLDLINTWQGSLLYFFILVLSIFILKKYFIANINVIEIQIIENKIMDK